MVFAQDPDDHDSVHQTHGGANRGILGRGTLEGVAAPPCGMVSMLATATRSATAYAAPLLKRQAAPTHVNLEQVRDALYLTYKDPGRWTVFRCIENHDLLDFTHTGRDRQPRIAALADPTNARSWYARSRAKVATGLLLAAPGVPMIFMGQEFLEDKYWSDWQGRPELLIWWEGLEGNDKAMSDQHRFTRDLMWLRRKHPALRAEGLNVFRDTDNRAHRFPSLYRRPGGTRS
jgi:1,4-alpha-glucan branching enzyme